VSRDLPPPIARRPRRHTLAALIGPVAATIVGCSGDGSCSPGTRAGVVLHVRSSAAGAPSLDAVSRVTVETHTFPSESASGPVIPRPNERAPLRLTWGRPGTYRLTVTAPGHRTWTRRVTVGRVTRDGCETADEVPVVATLEPTA
jgi:hypothetical protein